MMQISFHKKLKHYAGKFVFALAVISVASCGGGGGGNDPSGPGGTGQVGGGTNLAEYNGLTTEANITGDNVVDLALAAASGAKQAITVENTPLRPAVSSSSSDIINDLNNEISESLLSTSSRPDLSSKTVDFSSAICPNSGTAVLTIPDGYTGSGTVEMSYSFKNCTRSFSYFYGTSSMTVNGQVIITHSGSETDYTRIYDYQNLRVTISGADGSESTFLNTTKTCTNTSSQMIESCSSSSDFSGYGGETYRVTESTVTELGSNTFTVTAKVYNGLSGFISINGDVVYDGCSSGVPSSGAITFNANAVTASVEFNSCDSFTVTYGIDSQTYSWADILSGSFSALDFTVTAGTADSVKGLADIAGLWSAIRSGTSDDVVYLEFGESGDVNLYDYQGDSYNKGADCYNAYTNRGVISHISGNAFSSDYTEDFTAIIDANGDLTFTYTTINPETFSQTSVTVSEINSKLCV